MEFNEFAILVADRPIADAQHSGKPSGIPAPLTNALSLKIAYVHAGYRMGGGRDQPNVIRCDNGKKYISGEVNRLAQQRGICIDYSQPGWPPLNAYVEGWLWLPNLRMGGLCFVGRTGSTFVRHISLELVRRPFFVSKKLGMGQAVLTIYGENINRLAQWRVSFDGRL